MVWIVGYTMIITTLFKKDPMDPRFWLFIGVSILLVNGLSGILYIPSNIKIHKIIIYVILTIIAFHIGFGQVNTKIRLNKSKRVSLFRQFSAISNKIHIVLGLIGILGALLVCFEMFVIFGVSLDDGGDRRRQFQEALPFMVLTPIGMILSGGSFPSIFSIFCGGSKTNVFLGLLNMVALGVSSMAIAGKQGILFVVLILAYVYLFSHYYCVKMNVSKFVKIFILGIACLFVSYLSFLTIGRQDINTFGNLFERKKFTKEFAEIARTNLPKGVQNNFAEFLGYYGDQFPYVAERWDIENFENKYGYFRFPRILGPFTFLERQLIKIFPLYNALYPDDRVETIKNQSKGYFGNATWGSVAFLNIKYFGIIGGLIVFFFVGKISRLIYEHFFKCPTYVAFQMNYINCAGMFYFSMFYFTQETGVFIYLLILIGLEYYLKRKSLIEYYGRNTNSCCSL